MKLVRLLALVVLATLFARPAEAQRFFFDGPFGVPPTKGLCPDGGGGFIEVTVLQAYTGYFTDPNEPYPKTGDIAYVRAVGTNVSPCHNDVAGMSFGLPDGASLAISATNPVYCYVGIIGQAPSGQAGPPNGACLQTPQAGNYGGFFFGYSALPPGWYLDIRVPVVFNRKLLGLAGPTTHQLQVAADSAFAPYVIFPVQPVTVFYEADFENLASSGVTASAANLAYDLKSYFESGTRFIDYGTTTSFGSSLPGVAVPNTALSFPVTASLSGLSASTTYYWRARFVTASGTFTSPTRNFTTSGASAQLLTVNTGGTGTGTVTSSPAGISCGMAAMCTANFPSGTMVTLTATPATGSRLAAWSGDCSGTGSCIVTMSAPRTVNASIMRDMGSISFTLAGLPAGTSVMLGISGPDGFNGTQMLTTGFGVSLSDVPTGMYTVTPPNTTVNGILYTAPSQSATVNTGNTTFDIVYTQQSTSPPTGVVATATSPTSVTISWIGVKTNTYEVQRVGANGATTTIGSTLSGSIVDTTALANTAYLYKVRAILPSASAYSTPDLATTVIFTDPTLTATTTRVRAVHISELRTAVNAVRVLAGLGPASYTDPTLSVGVTTVKAVHLTDLRSALASARLALTLPALTYVTPTLTTGLPISVAHINDLRTAVR